MLTFLFTAAKHSLATAWFSGTRWLHRLKKKHNCTCLIKSWCPFSMIKSKNVKILGKCGSLIISLEISMTPYGQFNLNGCQGLMNYCMWWHLQWSNFPSQFPSFSTSFPLTSHGLFSCSSFSLSSFLLFLSFLSLPYTSYVPINGTAGWSPDLEFSPLWLKCFFKCALS